MSWAKNDEYEILIGYEENVEFGKKKGIPISHHFDETAWWSKNITINGENPEKNPRSDKSIKFHGIYPVAHMEPNFPELWKKISTEIPGLKCYCCNSQAYKTDQPGVAVCGAAPSWFFFYRRLAKEKKGMLKIVNGELKEVVDETPDQV